MVCSGSMKCEQWPKMVSIKFLFFLLKQASRGALGKMCSENMQQIYRRISMPKCDFNSNFIEIKLRYGCSPVNLLLIFRTPFPKNPSGWLLPFILRKRLLNSFILFCNTLKMLYLNPANMDLFKVNNRNSTKGVKYVQS